MFFCSRNGSVLYFRKEKTVGEAVLCQAGFLSLGISMESMISS